MVWLTFLSISCSSHVKQALCQASNRIFFFPAFPVVNMTCIVNILKLVCVSIFLLLEIPGSFCVCVRMQYKCNMRQVFMSSKI